MNTKLAICLVCFLKVDDHNTYGLVIKFIKCYLIKNNVSKTAVGGSLNNYTREIILYSFSLSLSLASSL